MGGVRVPEVGVAGADNSDFEVNGNNYDYKN